MKELDWVKYKYYNDRDLEEPLVVNFVSRCSPVESILDVGAHWSGHTYAPLVRQKIGGIKYEGIDILQPDEETPKHLTYMVGDVCDAKLSEYDVVLCISAIEHSGITTYQRRSHVREQCKVFISLLRATGKHLLLTHPYGEEGLYEGQYANITPPMLEDWCYLASEGRFASSTRYFYNPFCQGKEKWYEVDKQYADKVPMDKQLGIQCVAATEFTK